MIEKESRIKIFTVSVATYALLFIFAVKIRPLIIHKVSFSLIFLMVAYCILGCVGLYLFRNEINKGLSEWKKHSIKGILWLIVGYIADIILVSLFYYPSVAFCPDYEGMNDIGIESAAKLVSVPLFIVSAGILGPITEELIFRFILVYKLRSKIPSAVCVILSSALFMLWHIHALTIPELLINLPKFSTGIVYGIIIICSENPTIPILLHVLNNTLSIIMLLLSGTI